MQFLVSKFDWLPSVSCLKSSQRFFYWHEVTEHINVGEKIQFNSHCVAWISHRNKIFPCHAEIFPNGNFLDLRTPGLNNVPNVNVNDVQ